MTITQVETVFGLVVAHLDEHEELVGVVQSVDPTILQECLDNLHAAEEGFKSAGGRIFDAIQILQRYSMRELSPSDKRRLMVLEQKMEQQRLRFERSRETLVQFTRIVHEGMN